MLGGTPEYRAYMREHPVPQGPETLVGRVGLERRIVQIPDVLADPAYRWPVGRELGGYRTMLGAPMLAGDRVVGVLTLWRLEVDPFDDRTIALLNTLAAQAAVAIQNAELFQLGEISQAVSSTLDLDEVLTTIVARAAQLSGTEGGSIFEYDRVTGLFALRTCVGTDPGLMAELAATRIHIDETFIGRAAARRARRVQTADLALEPSDPHLEKLVRRRLALAAGDPAAVGAGDHRRAARAAEGDRRVPLSHRRSPGDAREPVRGGDPQRADVPGAAAEQPPARGREPAQVRVPGQHVA